MKTNKRIIFTLTLIILLITFPMVSFAHSGRTDSSGGHHDNKNKSGLGSYHYHHGMSAHLHPNGVCPYSVGGSSSQSTTTPKPTPKPSIKVNNISTTMNVGDTCGFDATIENTSDTAIKVTSSNTDVIFVNNDKTLSAKGVGTSTITIGNNTVSKSFTITVKEVFATDLEISMIVNELQIGDSLKVKSNITPSNTTNKNITYESSDENIATVTNDGTITGISSGDVTITATTSNDISKTLDITIFEVFPESIECDDSINLIVGDKQNFEINILPENTNNKNYTVLCDNEDILQYSDNKITAIKDGNTTLHIKTWNSVTKDIPVKVDIIPVETVDIIDSTKYIYSNIIDLSDNISLSTKISPNNATYQDIAWSSSNSNIVAVENNEFIVKGTGKVTLTCNSHENITDNIEIVVINKDLIVGIFIISVFGIVTITISIFVVKRKKKS